MEILAKKNKLTIIDGIVMKDKRIIIPFQLQKQILQQLHSNHMEIEKTRLQAHSLVYSLHMSTYIGNTIKQCATCLDHQNTQLQEKQYTASSQPSDGK